MLNSTRNFLSNLWRKKFGRYIIQDPQPTAAEAPYTYYLPPPDFLASVSSGDIVKIIFESVPISQKYGAERMWVIVQERKGDELVGILDNDPYDIPQLKSGKRIAFKISDIIDIDWNNDALQERGLERTPKRSYWDRCLVDSVVITDAIPIGFLYREAPDLGHVDDKHPDSGWRIRGNTDFMTPEECETESAEYVALGVVLNIDDSWLHLISEPIGSRFIKNSKTSEFEIDTLE